MNDLLTSMTEMSELRFLHHFPSLSIPLVNKSALYQKRSSTVLKHSMLDPYAKENYRDMLNAGLLDNKELEIL